MINLHEDVLAEFEEANGKWNVKFRPSGFSIFSYSSVKDDQICADGSVLSGRRVREWSPDQPPTLGLIKRKHLEACIRRKWAVAAIDK